MTILYDEARKKRIVQIDMEAIRKDPEAFEDMMDVLIAESRRSEPTISLDTYLKQTARRRKRS
ncbi:MAG: hypothetical protein U0U25_09005 [Flavobacteriales bacterium]